MKTVVGNWKMHSSKREGAARLSVLLALLGKDKPQANIVICPPFTLLDGVGEQLRGSGVYLGGQNCAAKTEGAFTGDISPKMLKDLGCRYVILGHSERRKYHGETDAAVRAKALAAMEAGLIPIICVGESWEEKERGETLSVVLRQAQQSVPAGRALIAYEPVWAIGSGKTPTLAEIQAAHEAISGQKGLPVLYGGSVNAGNAGEIFSIPKVEGALAGGASLDPDAFFAIVKAAASR